MNSILTALAAVIAPLEAYAEQKLVSIGAAFGAGLAVIAAGFLPAQRDIFSKVIAFWQAKYHAAVAAGSSTVDAIEVATTASLNEFAADEAAEGVQEINAIITLLASSVKNGFAT